ncbi:MAG: sigma 54-interacting transcriptional regulator, partial [Schleiferiaceae bacterium]
MSGLPGKRVAPIRAGRTTKYFSNLFDKFSYGLNQFLCFERLGDVETINVNVRVLAATNKDLQEEIAA